jgi:hypothetical protein
MIYIDAMRVRSPREGLGINVFLHLRPGPVPREYWTISQRPAQPIESLSWIEVPGGENSVEAFLDLVLDDGDYSPDLIEDAVEGLADRIEAGAPNPFTWTFKSEGGRAVHMVFSVKIGLEDLASKRRVLGELSDTIRRWMRHYDTQIPPAIRQLATSA